MKVKETYLKGCFIIEPTVYIDERGFFYESFNQKKFEEQTGHSGIFVQDNQSFSEFGTIRGLHLQKGDWAQAKLVRVLSGIVLDVAVDLREDSATYGKYFSIILNEINKLQLYIPRGFAHGFSVLSETAHFFYKCDNFYNKEYEDGIRFDDPFLGIDWKLEQNNLVISKKDLQLRFL